MGEGLKGKSQGQVHSVFRQRLLDLGNGAKNQAESLQQSEQRKWQVPPDLSASDLMDVPNLHKPSFDREPINTNYVNCVKSTKSAGTVGDVIGLKMQIDYIAAEERAFRARHSSPLRCLCHAMARRKFFEAGPTLDAIERMAADAIAAGAG